jgi:hypothetical protein
MANAANRSVAPAEPRGWGWLGPHHQHQPCWTSCSLIIHSFSLFVHSALAWAQWFTSQMVVNLDSGSKDDVWPARSCAWKYWLSVPTQPLIAAVMALLMV